MDHAEHPKPKIKGLALAALDLLLPAFCGACDERVSTASPTLCAPCQNELALPAENYCRRCGSIQGPYVGAIDHCVACEEFPADWRLQEVVAGPEHSGPMRNLILKLKFQRRHRNAAFIGKVLAGLLVLREVKADFVCPLPIHKGRLHERGYDQSLLIAKAISKELQIPCKAKVLVRVKSTRAQAQLSAAERRKNVSGAFKLGRHADLLKGKKVLIVDDVLTTGSTLAAAAKTLSQAEPESIIGVVASRSMH